METLKTQHDGIEIEYNEKRNMWLFELRGRERCVESLSKAKEIIDKPEPKDKPAFERIKAYTEGSYDESGFQVVDVTSIADGFSYKSTEYWISTAKKNRQKVYGRSLFPVCSFNDSLVTQINALDKQRRELDKKREELKTKLQQMPTQK